MGDKVSLPSIVILFAHGKLASLTISPFFYSKPISEVERYSNMKSFPFTLASTLCLADARLVSRDNATMNSQASLQSNNTRYAILDNGWSPTGFIPYLLALGSGMKVLGLANDTANTWVDQTTLHGVRLLPSTFQPLRKEVTYKQKSARYSRKGKPVLPSRSQRRDISPDTDV